jgi:hypothetical protein
MGDGLAASGNDPMKTTIYEVLKAKLGREPSHAELCADVSRILNESMVERAEQGKLRHQRKGRRA